MQRVAGRDHGTVTVVVTAFNDERFLDDCLVRARQSYADWRIVVVDDASTDALLPSPPPRPRRRPHRGGPPRGERRAERGTQLWAAAGRLAWVCFLDGDDFLLEASLADRVAVLAAANDRDDVAGSFAGWITVAEDARLAEFRRGSTATCPTKTSSPPLGPVRSPPMHRCCAPVLSLWRFDETMRVGAEDWDAWLRLMRSGYQFIGSGSRTGAYRMKRASMVERSN